MAAARDESRVDVVRVGDRTRRELVAALDEMGVRRNESAERLLASHYFDEPAPRELRLVRRTVGQLGLVEGGSLSTILASARAAGLAPCPLVTGPYLRLAVRDQPTAPDEVLSNGSAPSGSLTVASTPPDDDLPTGFYLRVIGGVPWLRGYRATDAHLWSPGDGLVFVDPVQSSTDER